PTETRSTSTSWLPEPLADRWPRRSTLLTENSREGHQQLNGTTDNPGRYPRTGRIFLHFYQAGAMKVPQEDTTASDRRRSGFKLIELMVAMSVSDLLAAILLPVIQHVRESARESQCKSNLRQIGQGLMQHSSS